MSKPVPQWKKLELLVADIQRQLRKRSAPWGGVNERAELL